MKLQGIILSLLLIFGTLYAEEMGTTVSERTVAYDAAKEIASLKAKIKELENELAQYKKVEPTASFAVLPSKAKKRKAEVFHAEKLKIGSPAPKKLSTYYVAHIQDANTLVKKLEENGFKILSSETILEGKTVISVTNDALLKTNTFLAALHILVDEDREIRVQNPSYFGAAFLGKSFTYGQFSDTLKALQSAMGEMYEVKEKFAMNDLADYNFMFGMPHFEDTIIVAEGEDLEQKIEGKEAERYISYRLTLPNGTILVGHKMKKSTYQYLKKIDAEHNALIFPYEVLIKEGKAEMLNPKYYLSLSLPLLSMTDFMKIASAPDAIKKDIERAYQ